MSELNFDSITKQIIDSCPLLTNAQIDVLLQENNTKPVAQYLYRIAVYAVSSMRDSEADDEPYLDALGDCAQLIPGILKSWKRDAAQLNTYAQHSFRRAARRSLAANSRGGMIGDIRNFYDAPEVSHMSDVSLPDTEDTGEESEYTIDDYVAYDHPPSGYGDPFEEVAAEQEIERLLKRKHTLSKVQTNRIRGELGNTLSIKRK